MLKVFLGNLYVRFGIVFVVSSMCHALTPLFEIIKTKKNQHRKEKLNNNRQPVRGMESRAKVQQERAGEK